ncbi:MAG: protein-glutamate O-methyltransferase CheR [bacterium]|nr:protein-glutamate O-methyltransferase CheR [bacterium]
MNCLKRGMAACEKMEIPTISLTDGEFQQIREIVWKTTGISLADSKKALVISRLARRLRELEIESFINYINRLKSDTDEILFLVNRITTNLTRFCREKAQFEILKERVLPEITAQAGKNREKNLRIWSAGCSTGEEVYTILFQVMAYFERRIPETIDLKIMGSDIDTNVLRKASSGLYSREELSGLEECDFPIDDYFEPVPGDQLKVKKRFRKYVLFSKINLVYDEFDFKNKIDVVFCRNVVIYFNMETKQKLYGKFHSILNEPGYFFSGHSENLFQYPQLYEFVGKSVYKKVV